MLRNSLLALSCLALPVLPACDPPQQDKFKSEGGISPDPSGIIAGSILYVGPRPSCVTEDGTRRVHGRVVLTLFPFDNPPPPEGRATTASNIMFLNPENMFTVADCVPEGRTPDPTEKITRAMDYSWPQIPLGTDKPIAYQIRSFYDSDEDMNPFFSVKNLPTAGDIAGLALKDVQNPSAGSLPIIMPPAAEAENGYKRQGVIVAIGNYVWMERPAFKVEETNRFLSSASVIAPAQNVDGSLNLKQTLEDMWGQTCARRGIPDCGLRMQQLSEEETATVFKVGDVQLDFSPERYAFLTEPVDILTVNIGAPDEAKPDMKPDPHPLMGSNLGIPYYTPITILTRQAPPSTENIMAITEAAAGIPNVRLIGSPLMDEVAGVLKPTKRVVVGDLPIAVPSVAAVELDPLDTACRLPYLAPGNLTRAFESRMTYCSELPTGIYGFSAIQGVAGGQRVEEPNPDISDNGYVVDGARLSGQAWTLPNDLSVPLQVGKDNVLASQGREQLLVVYDPEGEAKSCKTGSDPDMGFITRDINYRDICEPGENDKIENPAGAVGEGIDGEGCLPEHCCDGIMHLCNIELCELCTEETCGAVGADERHPIRQGPTQIVRVENGKNIPNCVPFEMPSLCCDRAEND
jgi:hypothetical protein